GRDGRRACATGGTSARRDCRDRVRQTRTCVSGSQAQARPRAPADRGGKTKRGQHHSFGCDASSPGAAQANLAPAAGAAF
ncbi:MAG TPA: hypothetical protein VJ860_08360, partial [Polyangia bacterium]|nr:hypothetical protein [Polyangia bacterium]